MLLIPKDEDQAVLYFLVHELVGEYIKLMKRIGADNFEIAANLEAMVQNAEHEAILRSNEHKTLIKEYGDIDPI